MTPTLKHSIDTPRPPTLTYLYSRNVTMGPVLSLGAGPKGTRTMMPTQTGLLPDQRCRVRPVLSRPQETNSSIPQARS